MLGVGVDVGGTSVKIGLVNEDGVILNKIVYATPKGFDGFILELVSKINELLVSSNISASSLLGIGIGVPGVVDEKGVILSCCNLGFYNVPLRDELKKHFNTEIKISNDANVATLAEVKFGAAKDYRNAVMLTIGTGVGGGVVLGGKLFEGGNCTGAELGHFTLVLGGEPCACGRRGCIESYVSASALIRQTKRAMLKYKDSSLWKVVNDDINLVDGKTAFISAKEGDKTANEIVSEYIFYLSDVIMSFHNVFRPEIFIIGGGISAEGKYLTDKIMDYCKRYSFGYKGVKAPVITTATLGNDAGIIGAYSLII